VWGPSARRLLERLSASDVSNTGFPYLTSRLIDVAGLEVRANRVSFAGELGWELVAPRDVAGRVWDAVLEGGRGLGIRPIGYYALNTLRLEKGFGYWGDDLTPSDTPWEAGLGAFVRLDKGDFLGREVLLRQRAQGVRRRMACLTTEADACVLYGGEA